MGEGTSVLVSGSSLCKGPVVYLKKKVLLRYNVRTIQFTTLYNLVVFRVFRVVQLSP